jgi:hypothetical protein
MNTVNHVTRQYKKTTIEKVEQFVVTLEKRGDRWMTRINGGVAFPSTNVEIYLWELVQTAKK